MVKQNQRQNVYKQSPKLMVIISLSLTSLGPNICVMIGVLVGLLSLHSLGPIHTIKYSAPENEKNAVKMKPKDTGEII